MSIHQSADRPVFDAADPLLVEDPGAYYARIRRANPSHVVPGMGLTFFRHAECNRVFRDTRSFGNDPLRSLRFQQLERTDPAAAAETRRFLDHRFFDEIDPPDHTRIRRVFDRLFGRRNALAQRERITELFTAQLDRLDGAREFDLVTDYAYAVPIRMVTELTGMPAHDDPKIAGWLFDIANNFDFRLIDGMYRAGAPLFEHIEEFVAGRRRDPQGGFIDEVIAAEDTGELSHGELLGAIGVLLVGGFETTASALCNGVHALLVHPEQFARLRDDPALLEPAVEEMLRFDGPVAAQKRIALTRVELGGHVVEPGEEVRVVIASANHDEDVFDDPGTFDVGRRPNPHLSFAAGVHHCLGAPLARQEMPIGVEVLMRRYREIHLLEAVERKAFGSNTLNSLKVAVVPR
ncbi:cytochrome P450 [Amycolatopsis thermophila]|uniref:Cytochrome P450 n=1 Tax=Amycolatopsis thermophila TaxID=206084 RepID=A0ABU0F6L5_9PSEU|nr:cytochrome P450 [Amycolatopsis thermophila]MDQ0382690.1 cytochrome P450 [Amycolatopsis thermophila]